MTPGTITEEGLLEARSANCLAAIGIAGGGAEAALALADVSTGRLEVFALAAADLADALGAVSPGEVLVADGSARQAEVARALAGLTVTPRPDARADPRAGERLVKAAYGVSTLDGFGPFSRAELIACALLVRLSRADPGGRGGPARSAAANRPGCLSCDRSGHPRQSGNRAVGARPAPGLADRLRRSHRHRGGRAAAGRADRRVLCATGRKSNGGWMRWRSFSMRPNAGILSVMR